MTRRPTAMAAAMREWAEHGLLNVAGGCCGTTPAHVAAIAEAVAGLPPRAVPAIAPATRLAGLVPVVIPPPGNAFVNVGERTNVTGSRKFARLIAEGREDEAVAVAREQVANGAQLIDVNMDEAMLDGVAAMTRFLRRIAVEPDIATVPVMVDSSRWAVMEAGLRQLQGRGVVNSISLKEGEAEFLRQARLCRAYGAAVVVMAFDELGQADTVERRVEVCRRAYRLLTEVVGFAPEDVILDPNIFAIATGIEEHNRYAIAFFEAVRRLKAELPGARTSGGVSNVSFAFRGNDRVREAIHAVFLYHAIRAGLDMAIVNAGVLPVYDDIDPELRERVEDVVLDRRPDATERLTEIAVRYAVHGRDGAGGRGPGLAGAAGGGTAHARPRRGDRRLDRGGHGRGPADHGPSARGHRGSADGRDERRRRPVRRRAHVPAPGGEERPRHEEGGRRPGPVSSRPSAREPRARPGRS